MKKDFYDGTKLLTLKDESGNKPEIFMCVGNRTAGKSYFFKRMIVRKFKKYNQKFCILVRFTYELDNIEQNFFKDLSEIDFVGSHMTGRMVGKGIYRELYLDDAHCGYAVALNTADTLKKYSSRFVDVENMFFDEFQSESNKYCPNEITKFQSVHISIARGGGEHVRYVPVFMCSNTVTVLNPYFAVFGVHKRLTKDTKYLRGNGWVLEQCFMESASKAIKESGFGRAFSESDYMEYAAQNEYLQDSNAFIEKVKGQGKLVANITCDDVVVGIWEHMEIGLLYCSSKYDPNFYLNYIIKTKDHGINHIMLSRSAYLAKYIKHMYEIGCVRFENLQIKNIVLDFLGYSVL